MKSPLYDIFFFQGSGVMLLLFLPWLKQAESSTLVYINLAWLYLFAWPHNVMTWFVISSKKSRENIQMQNVVLAVLASLGIAMALILALNMADESPVSDGIFTLILYYSVWHVFRQHLGIVSAYSVVAKKRNIESADLGFLKIFFTAAFLCTVLWPWSCGEIRFSFSSTQSFVVLHPAISSWMIGLLIDFTAALGAIALARMAYQVVVQRLGIPWPQMAVMAAALLIAVLPLAVVPISSYYIVVALYSVFHNIQYFGFVWLTEDKKINTIFRDEPNKNFAMPQRLVRSRSWIGYAGLALFCSAVIFALNLSPLKNTALFVLAFLSMSHYLIDQFIWRRDLNAAMPAVLTEVSRFN